MTGNESPWMILAYALTLSLVVRPISNKIKKRMNKQRRKKED